MDAVLSASAQVVPHATWVLLPLVLAATADLEVVGVWSLCASVVSILVVIDGGAATASLHFASRQRGIGDSEGLRPLIRLTLARSGAFALIVGCLALVATPLFVSVSNIPSALGPSATLSLGVCIATSATLVIANSLLGVLRGLGDYRAALMSTVASLIAIPAVLVAFGGLPGSATEAASLVLLQAVLTLITAALLVLRHLTSPRPRVPSRPVAPRAPVGYRRFARRSQYSTLLGVASLHSLPLIVAFTSTPDQAGVFYLAFIFALVFRTLPFYLLLPMRERLSFAAPDQQTAAWWSRFRRRAFTWRLCLTLWYLLFGIAALLMLAVTLQADPQEVTALYILLSLGFLLNLLVAPEIALLFASGRTDLEARVAFAGLGVQISVLFITLPFLALFAAPVALITASAISIIATMRYSRAISPERTS